MGTAYSRAECDAARVDPLANPALAETLKAAKAGKEEIAKVDYLNLPQPIKYEELQREAYLALKFETFDGLKFDVTKPLNQNFYVSHRLLLSSTEMPSSSGQVVKTPISDYTYGATVANERMILNGQMSAGGQLTSRAQWKVNQLLSLKLESRMVSERGHSQVMADVDLTGGDWNAQLKVGNSQFYGANYMQSITPTISAGAEWFYLAAGGKSGVGAVIRHATPKHVSTVQVATTGIVACAYFHKVSDKAQMATDFLWNLNSNEATASIGYDYHFRACRLRGNVDSNGKVAACLEERLAPSVTLVLTGELDHHKHDHRFGFGMTVGE